MFGIVYGSDSDNKIMNRFVDEYELWCNEGKNPDIASIDLDFALDLQKKRLDEKGVKIQTAFTDKETVKNETPVNVRVTLRQRHMRLRRNTLKTERKRKKSRTDFSFTQ